MNTDFVDEAGQQIPVDFNGESVIAALFRPFRAAKRTVTG